MAGDAHSRIQWPQFVNLHAFDHSCFNGFSCWIWPVLRCKLQIQVHREVLAFKMVFGECVLGCLGQVCIVFNWGPTYELVALGKQRRPVAHAGCWASFTDGWLPGVAGRGCEWLMVLLSKMDRSVAFLNTGGRFYNGFWHPFGIKMSRQFVYIHSCHINFKYVMLIAL